MRCGSDQVEGCVPPYKEWIPYDLAALALQRLEKEDRDLAPEWPMLVKQVFERQEQVILCLYGQNARGIRDEEHRWHSMNNASMALDQVRLLSQDSYTYTPQKLPHVAIVRLRDSDQDETPQAYRETSARYDREQAYALAAYLGVDSDLLDIDGDGKVRVPYATFATGGLFVAGPEHATLSDRICYSVAGRPDTLRDIGVKPDSKQFSFKGEEPEQRGALVRCVEIATPFLGTSFHNPREVQYVAHQLRLVHPFYDDATTFPLPIHWGMKLGENVIPVVDRFGVSS
jgi:hypothetical protein